MIYNKNPDITHQCQAKNISEQSFVSITAYKCWCVTLAGCLFFAFMQGNKVCVGCTTDTTNTITQRVVGVVEPQHKIYSATDSPTAVAEQEPSAVDL